MRISGSARSIVAVASGLVLIAGFVIDARSTTAAYLVAWSAWGAIPIGALIVFTTSYLVRRRWRRGQRSWRDSRRPRRATRSPALRS